jgi:dolichol kinase
MFAVIACLVGVFIILATAEILWRRKILEGEEQRKFVHISTGIFVAFWPWLISWRSIQLIGLAMLVGVLVNRWQKRLHFNGDIRMEGYGDVCFALAIIIVASLTTTPIFFALATLHLALADGLAAVIGKNFGKNLRYRVFHQPKTVIGSMTFWFLSACILGAGLLFADSLVPFQAYALLVIGLPPVLTILENVIGLGLDNVVVPVSVIIALQLAG